MAFMGIFMMYLIIILIILGVSILGCAACFIISGVIMSVKRRNSTENTKVKQTWYVVVLRIIGGMFAIPIVLCVVFIIYGAITNNIDKNNNLARAVVNYDYDQTEKILQNGADPNVKDKYGRTLFMCLTDHGTYVSNETDENYILEYDDCNDTDEKDIKMMELLLEYGADINVQKDTCGDNTQHIYGDDDWNGIYANSEHECGNTALMYALEFRSLKMISFLVENGADVNEANACGFTPVLMCVDNRSDDEDGAQVLKILIDSGADLHSVTNFHQDIFFLLTRQNNRNVDEMLEVINDVQEN